MAAHLQGRNLHHEVLALESSLLYPAESGPPPRVGPRGPWRRHAVCSR